MTSFLQQSETANKSLGRAGTCESLLCLCKCMSSGLVQTYVGTTTDELYARHSVLQLSSWYGFCILYTFPLKCSLDPGGGNIGVVFKIENSHLFSASQYTMCLFVVSIRFNENFHWLKLRAALVYGHNFLGGYLTTPSFNKVKVVIPFGVSDLPSHGLWPGPQYLALTPSRREGFTQNQSVGYPNNSHTTIMPVGLSSLEIWYYSMQSLKPLTFSPLASCIPLLELWKLAD